MGSSRPLRPCPTVVCAAALLFHPTSVRTVLRYALGNTWPRLDAPWEPYLRRRRLIVSAEPLAIESGR